MTSTNDLDIFDFFTESSLQTPNMILLQLLSINKQQIT